MRLPLRMRLLQLTRSTPGPADLEGAGGRHYGSPPPVTLEPGDSRRRYLANTGADFPGGESGDLTMPTAPRRPYPCRSAALPRLASPSGKALLRKCRHFEVVGAGSRAEADVVAGVRERGDDGPWDCGPLSHQVNEVVILNPCGWQPP